MWLGKCYSHVLQVWFFFLLILFHLNTQNSNSNNSGELIAFETWLPIPVFLSFSLQTMTLSACTLKFQRQPVPTPCHSSPKWTLAKVTENKYHIFPLKAITETRGCWIKCLKMWQFMWWTRMLPPSIRSGSLWLYRAQPGRGSCSVRVQWAAKQSCVLYKGMNSSISLENREECGKSFEDTLGENI